MGKTLKKVMNSSVKKSINKAFGKGDFMGVVYGTILTILVQSSSTTTSLIVPLAGAGVLTLRQIFPFTLGANIGTCITALLAATSISGANEIFALQIAIVHLMYNVLGVVLFLSIKFLRNLPMNSAQWLANKSEQNRLWSFGYLFTVFFVLPGFVFLVQNLTAPEKKIEQISDDEIPNTEEKKNFMIE
jgi:sodium-dependent phosphate cotransporter